MTSNHENRKLLAVMEPASTIIRKLGGEAKVREITRTGASRPYYWQYAKEKGGTGGLIPQRYHRALLDFAQQNGIELKADDFLPAREAAE